MRRGARSGKSFADVIREASERLKAEAGRAAAPQEDRSAVKHADGAMHRRTREPRHHRAIPEDLNKGVDSEFEFSNVKSKQFSPESQTGIKNSAPKTVEFR